MVITSSRRSTLHLTGAVLATSLAGCSTFFGDSVHYSMTSRPRGGTTLSDLFAWEPSGGQLHLRWYADDLAAELLETGTLTTESQPIGPYEPDDEDDPPPAYVEHDGGYHEVRVTDVEEVTLDRWELWFEPVDEAPDGVEPVEEPTDGHSELDAEIIRWAIDEGIRAVVEDDDLADTPHGERGIVFFDPLDPDGSDLVPEPPFEYVRVDPDTDALREKQTLRAHAQQGSVDTRRYVHETEHVADSREELEEVLDEHVRASFDRGDDSADILAEINDGGTYREQDSLSEEFERLLERLEVDDPSPPDPEGETRTWRRSYQFDGRYYHGTIRIRND